MNRLALIPLAALAGLAACQPAPQPPEADLDASPPPSGAAATAPADSTATAPRPPTPGGPLAYVEGRPVRWGDLQPGLLEAAGGQVLVEWVLAQAIPRRLAEKGLKLDDAALDRERQILLESLDPEADRAQRLLQDLRQRWGWGPERFQQTLARNAGLRALVQDEVRVTDAAVREAYEYEYGPRFEARLIVVDSLPTASDLIRRARAGESFIDLAIRHSSDSSRAQGGLLPPISPVDPTYPAAIRAALGQLAPGAVSDAVALDQGFAVLKLERKIDARPARYDDVKGDLSMRVRREMERMLMQRLARTLLSSADIVITDPGLQRSWKEQKARFGAETGQPR